MRVSVIVICYNEEENIADILQSLNEQTVAPSDYEVIVVDNASTDATGEIAREFAAEAENVRVVENPVRGIAPSRNVGLREARYDYVAYTDADCIVEPRWLEKLIEGMERHSAADPAVAAVGGGNIPADETDRFQRALGITLNSFWGSHGSAQGMLHEADREVAHCPTLNVLYDRRSLLELGGFDESFGNICEDVDLNHRLGRAGRRIIFLSDTWVRHKLRATLARWFRNVFTYGKGRSWVIAKHPDHMQLKFLVPPLIVLGLALLPLSFVHRAFAIFPVLYVVSVAFIALVLTLRRHSIGLWPWVFVILAGNPIAYGAGQMYGFLIGRPEGNANRSDTKA